MNVNVTGIVAGALLALVLVAPAASAEDLLGAGGFGLLTKQGVSGQVYAWQAGSCWGDPGTWSTSLGGRTYTWKGEAGASPQRIMRGMGLRPDDLEAAGTRRMAAARRDRARSAGDATRTRAPRTVRHAPSK